MRWKGQLLAIKYIYSVCNHPENAVKLCSFLVLFGLFMLGLECFSGIWQLWFQPSGCIYFTWTIKEISWSCNLFRFLLHCMFRNAIIVWWIVISSFHLVFWILYLPIEPKHYSPLSFIHYHTLDLFLSVDIRDQELDGDDQLRYVNNLC